MPTPSSGPVINPIDKVELACRLSLNSKDCTDVTGVIVAITNWLAGIAGTLFVIMFLVGGIQYLTSAGNEEGTTKAKNTLIWSIIGMTIVVASYAALRFFVDRVTG